MNKNLISAADQDDAEARQQWAALTGTEQMRLMDFSHLSDIDFSQLSERETIVAKWLIRAMILRIVTNT